MSYDTRYTAIEAACQQMQKLLREMTPEEQQEAMEDMEKMLWEIGKMPEPIRTDSPMAFIMDWEQALKNHSGAINWMYATKRAIKGTETPQELMELMMP